MAYYDGSAGATVFQTGITGTFSGGKTTTVDLLRDPQLAEACGLEEPYGLALIEVGPQLYGEGEPDQLMPLLTVSEASRRWAEQQGDPGLLGEWYNASVQHQIGFLATAQLMQARAQLATVYPILRREFPNVTNAAAILGDRSHLDSEVYFDINFPEEDQTKAGGMPVQRDRRFEAVTSLDAMFIADATEVPFEQEEARPDDEGLRLAIQQRLAARYAQFLQNEPYLLQGSAEERRDQVAATIGAMIAMPFVAQNPLTAYRLHRAQL